MHKAHPRVSIVIPAHNEERRIRACLVSIASQTSRPIEVIVVDNNCTDATARIAASFDFVTVITEPRQGIVFARNAGFDAASGDVIGRIDADVRLPRDWVAYVQAFYAEPMHRQQAWTGPGRFYNVRLPRLTSWVYAFLAFRINGLLTGACTLWGSNMAVTREQWLAVRTSVHERTDIHEDLDLTLHLTEAGYDIAYDTRIHTHAELRRVVSDRHKLWDYTLWWPNTLRAHRRRSWLVCWWLSVTVIYPGAYVLACVNVLAGAMERRSSVWRRSA